MNFVLGRFTISCTKCGEKYNFTKHDVDFESSGSSDRGMGGEALYTWNTEFDCDNCSNEIEVEYTVSEYPIGAFNHSVITIEGAKQIQEFDIDFSLNHGADVLDDLDILLRDGKDKAYLTELKAILEDTTLYDPLNYNTYIEKAIEIDPSPFFFNELLSRLWDATVSPYEVNKIISFADKLPKEVAAKQAWECLVKAFFEDTDFENAYKAIMEINAFSLTNDQGRIYDGNVFNPSLIDKITIQDYFCLSNLKVDNLSCKKEIYFLGENGVGKTLFLQAIVKSIKENNFENRGLGYFKDDKKVENYLNAFAYGVGRLRAHSNEIDTTGYGTLFDKQNTNLQDPVTWLKEVDRLEGRGIGKLKLADVLEMLNNILDVEGEGQIEITHNETTGEFIFQEQKTIVKFSELADGYRSILLVLADLLMRLSKFQNNVIDIQYYRGLVLIDEIDMLLHPKWEYTIVRKLRQKMPNIQWFFTTHSPVLILGASEDAVFYRLFKAKGKTQLSEPWQSKDIMHLMANGLITSPLFDLPTARMSAGKSGRIDTREDFWIGRIYDKIKELTKQEDNRQSAQLSPVDVDQLVADAINAIEKGEVE